MEWLPLVLLALVMALLYGVMIAWVSFSKNRPIQQSCLSCGERSLYITGGGKWDGTTPDGRRIGGAYSKAQCKECDACFQKYGCQWEPEKAE